MPARRRDARPHHPHQEHAARRCRRRSRARSSLRAERRARRWPASSPTTTPISRRENERVGGTKSKLDPLPRMMLVPGVGLFGAGAHGEGCEDRGRPRRERGARRCSTPKRSAASSRCPRATCSTWNIGRSSRRSSKAPGKAPGRPGRGGDRRRRRASARRRRRPSRARAPHVAILDIDGEAAAGRQAIGVKRSALACDVTEPAQVERGLRRSRRDLRRRRHPGLQCRRRMARHDRRRVGRGAAPELRDQFLRPSDRGAESRAHHAEAGHRRRPLVQRVQAGGQSRRRISAPYGLPKAATAAADAPICAGARRGRHPRQRA